MDVRQKTDHPYREIAFRNAIGKATQEERDTLLEDPEGWWWALNGIIDDLTHQLSKRKEEALAYKSRCLSEGIAGRDKWFEYRAEYQNWKRRTHRLLRLIEDSNREAKALAKSFRVAVYKEEDRELRKDLLAFIREDENLSQRGLEERDRLLALYDIEGQNAL
jgi:hypothetical protein